MPVTPRRARSWRSRLLLQALVVVLVALVPVALAMVQGRPVGSAYDFVRAAFAAEPEGPPPTAPGTVRVLVSGRTIPAYTKLTRDDLWSPERGSWAHTDIEEEVVESAGVFVDAGDIIGRVLKREKKPGYVFTERDFLPEGTRPGFSAGIPPGKRALRVEVDRVAGIVGLLPGDRFDIVSAVELEPQLPRAAVPYIGPYKDRMESQRSLRAGRVAKVRALVQNGVVVSPLETRAVPITSSSLTSGRTTRTIPVQEMVIAMDPEEVAPFMEAIAIEADLQCLARSGHPEDPADSVTPSSDPQPTGWESWPLPGGPVGGDGGTGAAPLRVVESIDGDGRSMVPVPAGRGEPASDPR